MTSRPKRNVLVVGVNTEEFSRVAPFLGRDDFEIDRFPSGAGLIELTQHVPVEVLIVRYPLPDMDLAAFLTAVRHPDNRSRHASLVLLAERSQADDARRYIGRGANRVVVIGESEDQIQQVVSGLLNVAPRKSARFLARLEIKVGGAKDMMLCQTENVSATGMLIRIDQRYELGTEIHFEINLAGDPRPVSGVAEVVRHTQIGRDDVGGIGVVFRSFTGDSQRRFDAWRERQ